MDGVRGTMTPDAPLAPYTWLRVGGPAELLFQPADAADLALFLERLPMDSPVTPIGLASNLLVRDGGVEGVVIRLGRGFNAIAVESGGRVRAGAAVPDALLARAAAKAGIAGLEFFVGVPGSVGGAVTMNAGCYGSETKDVLVEATLIRRDGRREVWSNADLDFAYRHSATPADAIVVEAVFEGRADEHADIEARMAAITERREASQPIREKTSGSTFKNPGGELSAWQVVDRLGYRGLRRGGARFSEQHANFLINDGSATAQDLEGLGEEVRAAALRELGVALHWEVRRIGYPADPES